MFLVTPPALPGGGQFPVEFVIASTAETEAILDFAQQIQLAACSSAPSSPSSWCRRSTCWSPRIIPAIVRRDRSR